METVFRVPCAVAVALLPRVGRCLNVHPVASRKNVLERLFVASCRNVLQIERLLCLAFGFRQRVDPVL